MRVILARHGDAANSTGKFHGLRDEPLTNEGRTESYKLAKELLKYQPTMIFYSPLSRNRDTARILSEELDIPKKAAPQLHPLDAGNFVGKSLNAHLPEFKQYLSNPATKIPGGQSVNEWAAQYLPFFERYFKNKSKQTIIFVTHGRNILLTKAYLDGGGLAPTFDKSVLINSSESTEHGGYAIADKNRFEIIDAKKVKAGES